MVRYLSRIPLLRSLTPKISTPILPLSSRLRPAASLLTQTVRRHSTSRLFHHFPARLTPSRPSSPKSQDPRTALPPDASLSQRLKHLIKSYGWYALGVYILISVLDFSVAFAGIQLLGAEQVSRLAMSARHAIAGIFHSKPPEPGLDEMESMTGGAQPGHEGLYATLVLAYTVHKTLFLPVRVGLTAALTPRLVGWLSQRGWAGGEGTRRAAAEMRERLTNRRSRDQD